MSNQETQSVFNNILRVVRRSVRRCLPAPFEYYLRYSKVAKKHGKPDADVRVQFTTMLSRSEGRPSLQIGARGKKYAPHFVSIDLYDTSPIIDFQYDLHNMPFEPEKFDFAVCSAVLEHVEDPVSAISELHRVLRSRGEIWVEVPLTQPYHPSPGDFWRVTHTGIRIWMKDFTEISSGLVQIDGSPIYDYVYFHGFKTPPESVTAPRG
jgi:SAM-dependent methyltransferase